MSYNGPMDIERILDELAIRTMEVYREQFGVVPPSSAKNAGAAARAAAAEMLSKHPAIAASFAPAVVPTLVTWPLSDLVKPFVYQALTRTDQPTLKLTDPLATKALDAIGDIN